MKFKDIPEFFHPPHYNVNVSWDMIEAHLERYSNMGIEGFDGLNLDPDFQRGHVWSEEKQIAYVEFCLRGGQSSRVILFNHPNWRGSYKGEMTLVDGKQRLEAVRKFIRNELPIFGGNFLNDFDDSDLLLRSTYAELEFKVNNLKNRKDLLEWYLQLNTGGVIHTDEEIEKVQRLLEEEK